MRRPWLALLASYGTVVATTSAEDVFQFLIPTYLEQSGYPVSLIGFYYALPFAVALMWRVPAGLLYRPFRARVLVAGAGLVAAITSFLLSHASGPLAFALVRAGYAVAAATITTVTLAHFMGTIAHGPGRSHAMGYYAGALAGGFTIGNLAGGFVGQRWGYPTAFAVGAAFELGVVALWRAVGLVASAIVLAEDPDPRLVSRGLASGVYNAAGDLGSLTVAIGGGLLAAVVGIDALFWLLPGAVLAVYFLAATALERARPRASAPNRPVATGRG
jgi:MFS family permease